MSLDVENERRVAGSLLAAGGGVAFTALNLIGATLADNPDYARGVALCLMPLAGSLFFSMSAFISNELAADPKTPNTNKRYSKLNFFQTAKALSLGSAGLLIWGGWRLVIAAVDIAPVAAKITPS